MKDSLTVTNDFSQYPSTAFRGDFSVSTNACHLDPWTPVIIDWILLQCCLLRLRSLQCPQDFLCPLKTFCQFVHRELCEMHTEILNAFWCHLCQSLALPFLTLQL